MAECVAFADVGGADWLPGCLGKNMHSLRSRLDHRDDARANGLGQLGPGGHDDGQVRVFG